MVAHRCRAVGRASFVWLALFVTLSVLAISNAVGTAMADVPDVLEIEDVSQPYMGRIRLRIRHANPGGTHYIDTIDVDINGQVSSFNLQPQSTSPFTAELDLGQFQGKPNVKARAHCNLHGWSAWSGQIQIPEFREVGGVVFAAMILSILIAKRKRNR